MATNRILFYSNGTCNEQRTIENLKRIGCEVAVVSQNCENYDLDSKLIQTLLMHIHRQNIETLFSIDYYPVIAEVAHTVGIPYISWIIDAPHYTLYSPTSFYDEVYVFHFDREESDRLSSMGRHHVFHQPLASDPEYFQSVISRSPARKRNSYLADICFLGSSYQNEHNYYSAQNGLSEYERGYFDALIYSQLGIYGSSVFNETLTDTHIQRIINCCDLHKPINYDLPDHLIAENVLEKKVSVIERQQMIIRCADAFGITLFSQEDTFPIPGVRYRGYADYDTIMPLVFSGSKINLNTTLRYIHSGIPLRALDIMACGGFLLSNYQLELMEYFTPGKDFDIYEDMNDLIDKCKWYLDHEDIRNQIAENGKQIIYSHFTYINSLLSILSKIN